MGKESFQVPISEACREKSRKSATPILYKMSKDDGSGQTYRKIFDRKTIKQSEIDRNQTSKLEHEILNFWLDDVRVK